MDLAHSRITCFPAVYVVALEHVPPVAGRPPFFFHIPFMIPAPIPPSSGCRYSWGDRMAMRGLFFPFPACRFLLSTWWVVPFYFFFPQLDSLASTALHVRGSKNPFPPLSFAHAHPPLLVVPAMPPTTPGTISVFSSTRIVFFSSEFVNGSDRRLLFLPQLSFSRIFPRRLAAPHPDRCFSQKATQMPAGAIDASQNPPAHYPLFLPLFLKRSEAVPTCVFPHWVSQNHCCHNSPLFRVTFHIPFTI